MSSLPVADCQCSLDQLYQVGGVRAYRLRRDLGLSSAAEVATCTERELQSVRSIGPVRAKQILASANAHYSFHEDQLESPKEWANIALFFDAPDTHVRADDAALHTKITESVTDAVESTLGDDESFDPVRDEVRLITPDDMPEVVESWVQSLAFKKSRRPDAGAIRHCTVEAPWDKYRAYSLDVPADEELTTAERQLRSEKEPELWKAARDRNAEIAAIATHVVIVAEGEYTDNLRDTCERLGTHHKTYYTTISDNPGAGLVPYDPTEELEFRGWEIDDVETWRRTATKFTEGDLTADLNTVRDELQREQSSEKQSTVDVGDDDSDDTGPVEADTDRESVDFGALTVKNNSEGYTPEAPPDEPRPGSELDMADDEMLSQAPAETLDEESRLDRNDLNGADPGGGKVDEYYDSTT